MKQKAKNACGTIGLFHIILNALEKYPDIVAADSYLKKFKTEAAGKNPDQIATLFKENKELLGKHKSAASEGQSEVVHKVDAHFISFISKEGHLYELDGFKKCPVDHGECTEEETLAKGMKVIGDFMKRDPDNINFSMIAIAKKGEWMILSVIYN